MSPSLPYFFRFNIFYSSTQHWERIKNAMSIASSSLSTLLLLLSHFYSSQAAPTPPRTVSNFASSSGGSGLGSMHTNFTSPTSVAFTNCNKVVSYNSSGSTTLNISNSTISSVTIMPCERGGSDEPCRFRFGSNYTISVNYTSNLEAVLPRTTLMARDDTVVPSLRYPYSGESFGGCEVSPNFESSLTLLKTWLTRDALR